MLQAFVPAQKRQDLQVGWAQVLTSTEDKRAANVPRWEYLTVHVAFAVDREGLTVVRVDGEAEVPAVQAGTAMHDALRDLGLRRWELVSVVPAAGRELAHLYVFKRPMGARQHRHLTVMEEEGDDRV